MLGSCLRRSVAAALGPRVCSSDGIFVRCAGHNKWSKIGKDKGIADQKQAGRINVILTQIKTAVRDGGADQKLNHHLATVFETGSKMKIEKAVMEGAVKKAVESPSIDHILEGRSPLGFAVVIHISAETNLVPMVYNHMNRGMKRLCVDLNPGTSLFAFEKKVFVTVPKVATIPDDLDALAIECGAEDWREKVDDEGHTVIKLICDEMEVHPVKQALKEMNIAYTFTDTVYLPKGECVDIEEKDNAEVEALFEYLDDHEDVVTYFTNITGHEP